METKKFEDLSKGGQIKADLYSRDNTLNGKYEAGNLGLDDLVGIKDKDIFFLETLKIKADYADNRIAATESEGKDTGDPKIMKKLGEQINVIINPIHRNYAVMTAVWCVLQLVVIYALAGGIWGLVFEKSFFIFSLFGSIVGLLISTSFAPVISSQRTKELLGIIVSRYGILLLYPVFWIGVFGLVVLIIRLIFF